jgi:F-type H+-transporting ATPase subunit b
MLIDWFTVGAQVLNFLILVWLMKRFLYQPILNAIDVREKRIAAELADADARKTAAGKERDDFQHKNEQFDQQRAALLTKATDEANVERQRLLDDARKAADALTAKRREALDNDTRNLQQLLAQRTGHEVFAIARKTLADLAATSLDERIGEVFLSRLQGLDASAKASLSVAIKTASEPAIVRSAFDVPPAQRAAMQAALDALCPGGTRIRFETAPDLIGGIELIANGQKLAWSIADYLASLEERVGDVLKQQSAPQRAQAPKSDSTVGPAAAPPVPKAA